MRTPTPPQHLTYIAHNTVGYSLVCIQTVAEGLHLLTSDRWVRVILNHDQIVEVDGYATVHLAQGPNVLEIVPTNDAPVTVTVDKITPVFLAR